ncbi:hypothetical protein M501DRAFT_1017268 [Patellaria atrata CBS 101060]|uniref:Uncharacterized protein n=1 Tax=Patellaria atrata CBS 101060 TaxID=1346257 RepID=A0A9P4SAX3_9PEZI|nr:hypothetical protein M501DRAFT_1017268 [Patellaria atrata CBS 101060]
MASIEVLAYPFVFSILVSFTLSWVVSLSCWISSITISGPKVVSFDKLWQSLKSASVQARERSAVTCRRYGSIASANPKHIKSDSASRRLQSSEVLRYKRNLRVGSLRATDEFNKKKVLETIQEEILVEHDRAFELEKSLIEQPLFNEHPLNQVDASESLFVGPTKAFTFETGLYGQDPDVLTAGTSSSTSTSFFKKIILALLVITIYNTIKRFGAHIAKLHKFIFEGMLLRQFTHSLIFPFLGPRKGTPYGILYRDDFRVRISRRLRPKKTVRFADDT